MRYKGIRHEILKDAPFIGALIIAPYCFKKCEGCHNQHLMSDGAAYMQSDSAEDIIEKVLNKGLNEGIILGGLEWTYTPRSLRELVNKALQKDLKVFINTFYEQERFEEQFPKIVEKPVYVKYGSYQKEKQVKDNIQYSVKLPTSNQHIKAYRGL